MVKPEVGELIVETDETNCKISDLFILIYFNYIYNKIIIICQPKEFVDHIIKFDKGLQQEMYQ